MTSYDVAEQHGEWETKTAEQWVTLARETRLSSEREASDAEKFAAYRKFVAICVFIARYEPSLVIAVFKNA